MYENFERLLKQKGVRAVDVANATGIATSTLSEWKKGKTQPKFDKLRQIAAYFEVPVSALTGGSDMPEDGISATEWQLVSDFRSLDDRGRASVLHALAFELSQSTGSL